MKLVKALLAAIALSVSFNAMALSDDESLEYVNGLTEGDMKIVKKFVEADPKNVNEKSYAWSPLQMAANRGQLEVAKYLVEKGADLNYVHPLSKNTAFHLAIFNGHKEMAEFLAKSGADVNKKLKANVSLLRPFQDADNKQMVEYLTGLGVKDDGCKEQKCFEEPD